MSVSMQKKIKVFIVTIVYKKLTYNKNSKHIICT